MRNALHKIGSEDRHTFKAKFGKYGYKRYHDENRGELYTPTLVVRNVEMIDDKDNPQAITDHLWLNLTKGFADLGLLSEGDEIQFNGRVSEYVKGHIKKDKTDYELTYPTKIKLLIDRKTQALPEDHRVLIGMIMNLNYRFYVNNKRPLVPYFMDAFDVWQKEQENPLPIASHKGNNYEDQKHYDPYDYKTEAEVLKKAIKAEEKQKAEQGKLGVKILQDNPDLTDNLVKLGRQLKAKTQEQSAELEKYCYISNGKLRKFLKEKGFNNDSKTLAQVRQAIASEWFHKKFDKGNSSEMSWLEQLAQKFNG